MFFFQYEAWSPNRNSSKEVVIKYFLVSEKYDVLQTKQNSIFLFMNKIYTAYFQRAGHGIFLNSEIFSAFIFFFDNDFSFFFVHRLHNNTTLRSSNLWVQGSHMVIWAFVKCNRQVVHYMLHIHKLVFAQAQYVFFFNRL